MDPELLGRIKNILKIEGDSIAEEVALDGCTDYVFRAPVNYNHTDVDIEQLQKLGITFSHCYREGTPIFLVRRSNKKPYPLQSLENINKTESIWKVLSITFLLLFIAIAGKLWAESQLLRSV